MKKYGVEEGFHIFLTSAIDGGGGGRLLHALVFRPKKFCCIRKGLSCPQTSSEQVGEEKKIYPYQESKPESSGL
jgi:hypothetical protein